MAYMLRIAVALSVQASVCTDLQCAIHENCSSYDEEYDNAHVSFVQLETQAMRRGTQTADATVLHQVHGPVHQKKNATLKPSLLQMAIMARAHEKSKAKQTRHSKSSVPARTAGTSAPQIAAVPSAVGETSQSALMQIGSKTAVHSHSSARVATHAKAKATHRSAAKSRSHTKKVAQGAAGVRSHSGARAATHADSKAAHSAAATSKSQHGLAAKGAAGAQTKSAARAAAHVASRSAHNAAAAPQSHEAPAAQGTLPAPASDANKRNALMQTAAWQGAKGAQAAHGAHGAHSQTTSGQVVSNSANVASQPASLGPSQGSFAAMGAPAASAAGASQQPVNLQMPKFSNVQYQPGTRAEMTVNPTAAGAYTTRGGFPAYAEDAAPRPRGALLQMATLSDAHSHSGANAVASARVGAAALTDASAVAHAHAIAAGRSDASAAALTEANAAALTDSIAAASAAAAAAEHSSVVSAAADGAAQNLAVQRLTADLVMELQTTMQKQVRHRIEQEIALREKSEYKAKAAEQAYATIMGGLTNAAESMDEAVMWSDQQRSYHPNLKAFLLPVGILLTIVIGMTACWTDVERLSVRKTAQ